MDESRTYFDPDYDIEWGQNDDYEDEFDFDWTIHHYNEEFQKPVKVASMFNYEQDIF